MRAYYASPYASHLISKDAAVRDAMRALTRLPGWLKPVLHVNEVRAREHCVWSPLIQGQIMLRQHGPIVCNERAMLKWCLWNLEHRFDTLILSNTIPRKPGWGRNGMDAEQALACDLGHRIMLETEVWEMLGGP